MKNIIVVLVAVSFLLTGLSGTRNAWAKNVKDVSGAKKKTDKAKEQAAEAQRVLAEKARQALNNTEWAIDLSLLSAKGKKEPDTLTFKENQVSVSSFHKKGFAPTNYTITAQDDGTIVWETMQSSEKSGVVFWRGEIDPEMQKMHGILSYHVDDKTTRDYSFASVSKKDISPAPTK